MKEKKQKKTNQTKCRLSINRLDEISEVLNEDPVGKIALLFGLLKMILAVAYIWTRNKMMEEQWKLEKQEYEIKRDQEAKDEIRSEEEF